jgi:hypothetical protein
VNRLRVSAIAAIAGGLVLAGCGSGHNRGIPLVYRGEAHGVQMKLKRSTMRSSSYGPLTLHFGPGSQAVRERALRTKHLQLFCFWPTGPRSNASQADDAKLNPLKRTQLIEDNWNGRSTNGYSCALGAHTHSDLPEWPATRFLKHAIVAVHLSRSAR